MTDDQPLTRAELLRAVLAERYGPPVPPYHPWPGEHTSNHTWQQLRVLHDALRAGNQNHEEREAV